MTFASLSTKAGLYRSSWPFLLYKFNFLVVIEAVFVSGGGSDASQSYR